jgi:PAS domain S-box-containing protein
MNDSRKTKKQLIDELEQLRKSLKYEDNSISSDKNSIPIKGIKQNLFDEIFDLVPVSIIVTDSAGKIVDINSHHLSSISLGKKSKEDFLGKIIWELPALISAGISDQYKSVVEGKKLKSNEVYFPLLSNGKSRHFNVRGEPIFDENGISGAVFVHEDVTVSKKHEYELTLDQEYLEEVVDKRTKDLKESEGRFKAAFDSASDHVLIWDKDYNYLYANQVAIDYVGTTADKIIGKNIRDGLGHIPEFMKLWMDRIDKSFNTQKVYRVQDEQAMMGKTYFTDSIISPIIGDDGEVTSVCVVHRDITELVKAEKKLNENQERLMRVVNSVPIVLWEIDKNGIFTISEGLGLKILGLKPGQVVGLSIYDVYKDFPDLIASVESGLAGETEFDTLYIGEKAFETNYIPRFDNKNSVIGLIGISFDVSERIRAEELLSKERKTLEVALESQNDTFFIFNPSTGKAVRWNEAFTTVSEYSNEEIAQQKAPESYYSHDDLLKAKEVMEKVLAGKKTRVTMDFITKSGSKIPFEYNVNMIESDVENEVYLVSVGRDITERKIAEEEKLKLETRFQEAQKKESLSILAGGIAHDFNNLLTGILGNASLALMEISPVSPAKHSIQEIEESAIRAAELTKQMLAYSGKGQFVIKDFDLSELVSEMTRLVSSSISKKAHLNILVEKNLPAMCGDITQIRQIAMNIIINASEALENKSGTITIRTGVQIFDENNIGNFNDISPIELGEYVYMSVEDDGCGIDKDSLKKIFDPFYTTKFTGRGLGLAATQGAIEGHKGAIEIKSRLGIGTKFTVYFPQNGTYVDGEEKQSRKIKVSDHSELILVVDDEPAVLSLAKRTLELAGHTVITATDGVECIKVYEENRDEISLVLLDLKMPNLSGEEAFREIKKINPDAIVVLSSGYSEDQAKDNFRGLGLSGFIQKPYHPIKLIELVEKILSTEKK